MADSSQTTQPDEDEDWFDGYQGAIDNLRFIASERPGLKFNIDTLIAMLKAMAPEGFEP